MSGFDQFSTEELEREDDLEEVARSVELVVRNAHRLDDRQINLLVDSLSLFASKDVVDFNSGFDLSEEIGRQIAMVRALRDMVLDPTWRIREEYSARDAKEVISSASTLLTTLMRFHEKIVQIDRQKAIEVATIEAIKTLPEEVQERFFGKLEELLADEAK